MIALISPSLLFVARCFPQSGLCHFGVHWAKGHISDAITRGLYLLYGIYYMINITGVLNMTYNVSWVHAKLLQSCLTLCNPMNCSPPDSLVHRVLQVKILEWVAISHSRDLSNAGIKSLPHVSCIGRQVLSTSVHLGSPECFGISYLFSNRP